jgi:hypothetical protein
MQVPRIKNSKFEIRNNFKNPKREVLKQTRFGFRHWDLCVSVCFGF